MSRTHKRLVSLGCSLTKDFYQNTWPNFLSKKLNLECVNIGARGAGLDFLSKRLLSFDLQIDDFVVIMLPSADRFDWYVEHGDLLSSQALKISSWQDGKSTSLINLDGGISEEYGFSLTGGNHRGIKKYWYKYFYSQEKAELDYWAYVVLIQNFLKIKNISYLFTSAYDKNFLIENKNNTGKSYFNNKIISHIDFDNFYYYKKDKGFLSFCKKYNFEIINNHPVESAHRNFSNLLFNHIQKNLDRYK